MLHLERKVSLATWLVVAVLVISCQQRRQSRYEQQQEISNCYSFIQGGRLVLQCPDARTTTTDLNLQAFAVSANGSYLAFMSGSGNDAGTTMLIDLRAQNATTRSLNTRSLASSCGKLIASDAGMTTDVVSGRELSKPPYTLFRCSSDEAVVVGYQGTWKDPLEVRLKLWRGLPPRSVISSLTEFRAFDVSPNGKYIAYSDSGSHKTCIVFVEKLSCTNDAALAPVSVSDSGEVIFSSHRDEGCFYKDPSHFEPSSIRSNDACLGIYKWQIGIPEEQLLEPIGRDPQWVAHPDWLKAWMVKATN